MTIPDSKPQPLIEEVTSYWAGLDLGQSQDFTALVVLERKSQQHRPQGPRLVKTTQSAAMGTITESPGDPPKFPTRLGYRPPLSPRRYAARLIQRFDLGTSYPVIVERLVELFSKPPLVKGTLVIDATGVGRAVVDDFNQAAIKGIDCKACQSTGFIIKELPREVTCLACLGKGKIKLQAVLRPVTITGGFAVTPDANGFHVPKKELVSVLQVLLQQRRLQVARALPHAATLVRELETFRVKITTSANEQLEAWRQRDHDDLVLALGLAVWVAERGVQQFWMK